MWSKSNVMHALVIPAITGMLIAAAYPQAVPSAGAPLSAKPLLITCSLVPLLLSPFRRRPLRFAVQAFVAWGVAHLQILSWAPRAFGFALDGGRYQTIALCAALVLYCSLFPALAMSCAATLERRGMPLGVTLPPLWCLAEWLRGIPYGGFSWTSIGYTLYEWRPALSCAAVVGIYGVGAAIIAANLCLAQVFESLMQRRQRTLFLPGGRWAPAAGLLTIALFGAAQKDFAEERPARSVAIVQPGRPTDSAEIRSPASTFESIQKLLDEAQDSLLRPWLVVMPEDVYPRKISAQLHRLAGINLAGSWAIIGGLRSRRCGEKFCLHNSAFLLSPQGEIDAIHDKHLLVPIAEGSMGFFKSQLGLTPGAPPQPLRAEDVLLGVLICYESMDPRLSRRLVERGAELLVNPTSDYFQRGTSEPAQHLAMVAFRAAETGRWLLRASTSEGSALIGPDGIVRERAPSERALVLHGKIQPRRERTIYTLGGELIALAMAGWPLLLVLARRGRVKGS